MMVSNLAVRNTARSVRFYRDTIGMALAMIVWPLREVGWPGEIDGASFAMLMWDDCQLMLQTAAQPRDWPLHTAQSLQTCQHTRTGGFHIHKCPKRSTNYS